MKIFSLLKAILHQDMNLFNYKSNQKGKLKIIVPLLLFIIIGVGIGGCVYSLSVEFAKVHLTYIVLSIMLMLTSLMTIIGGITKSQSILFDCKDNDLLFSLPIKKSTILLARVIKLLLFEYLVNFMILFPTYIVYIILERPGIYFYFISMIIIILIPIIPLIVSCFIGYLIKIVSIKMKTKKLVQSIFTIIGILTLLYFSSNMESMIENIIKNANSINNFITAIFYTIGLYISLLHEFDLIKFLDLFLVNIVSFLLFIIICQKFYFKIISNSKNNIKIRNTKHDYKIIVRKPFIALINKEIKRYLNSPTLMFNASMGLIFLVISTVLFCFKGVSIVNKIEFDNTIDKNLLLNLIYYYIVQISLLMITISVSSISLEGKNINIIKSLPIDYKMIIKSKIISCFIIEFSVAFISILLFIMRFKVSLIFAIELLTMIVVMIFFNAFLGLVINLKYPKLNFNTETEAIQGACSLISMSIDYGYIIITILIFSFLYKKISIDIILIGHLLLMILINIVLYQFLMKKGPKQIQKLNI